MACQLIKNNNQNLFVQLEKMFNFDTSIPKVRNIKSPFRNTSDVF